MFRVSSTFKLFKGQGQEQDKAQGSQGSTTAQGLNGDEKSKERSYCTRQELGQHPTHTQRACNERRTLYTFNAV